MTTGSKTRDLRAETGVGLAGPVYTKSWSGVDSPKVAKPSAPRPQHPPTITYPAFHPSGRVVTVTHKLPFRRFERPIARARRSENPYTAQAFNFADVFCKLDDGRTMTTQRAGINGGVLLAEYPANDIITLIGKLRTAIAGSDWNAGVTVAESSKALDLIFDSTKKIASALKAIKRGNISAASAALFRSGHSRVKYSKPTGPKRSFSKDISGELLKLQYGVLPLLKDVESAAQFLAHQNLGPGPKRITVRHWSKVQHTFSMSVGGMSPGKTKSILKGQIAATISDKNVVQLAGLTDPLSIAWELTPWSFVVDWFIPIGNYLQARALSSGIDGTFVTSIFRYGSINGFTAASNILANGTYTCEAWDLDRSVSKVLSVPFPSFKSPSSIPSWKKAAISVALLISIKK